MKAQIKIDLNEIKDADLKGLVQSRYGIDLDCEAHFIVTEHLPPGPLNLADQRKIEIALRLANSLSLPQMEKMAAHLQTAAWPMTRGTVAQPSYRIVIRDPRTGCVHYAEGGYSRRDTAEHVGRVIVSKVAGYAGFNLSIIDENQIPQQNPERIAA